VALAAVGWSITEPLLPAELGRDGLSAAEIGLVRAAVPPEDLDAAVEGRVNELLQSGPRAIAEAKALIREVAWRRVEDVQRYTVERISDLRVSPEGQEGMRAFLEKRKPSWVR
jgi:methylglutaconyl-CoA hydratase